MAALKVAMVHKAALVLLCSLFVCCTAQLSPNITGPNITGSQNATAPSCKMDIIFIVDASGSVGTDNFLTMLQFVHKVVAGLVIGPFDTQVGMFLFSHIMVHRFFLNTFSTKQDILDAVLASPYIAGGTFTHTALATAGANYFNTNYGMRRDAAQVAIVITDGYSAYPSLTAREAPRLREKGVTVFAVGVGDAVHAELEAIASDPDSSHVFNVSKFEDLSLFQTSLRREACRSEPAYLCSGQADIMFLLDQSSSVGPTNFPKMLGFVRDVADTFIVSTRDIQIGLATFSTAYSPWALLNSAPDKATLGAILSRVTYSGGSTNTGNAIMSMRSLGFSTSYGHRVGVPKIAVVVTDGKSGNKPNVIAQAQEAQNSGITMLAIAIGYNTDEDELNAIATDPDSQNVHRASAFDALKGLENYVASIACEAVAGFDNRAQPCGPQADVVFLVDTSGSVGPDNFRLLLNFINSFVKDLQIGQDNIRVGVLKFGSRPYKEFDLNRFDSKMDLMNAIMDIEYLSGGTDMAGAIRYMDSVMFKAASGNRPGIPDIAVIVTDGKSNQPWDTRVAAQQARDNGITIFSVGVGNGISREELNEIASDPDNAHVLTIKEFTKLSVVRAAFQIQACEAIPQNLNNTNTTKPQPTPQDQCRDLIDNCADYSRGVCNTFLFWAIVFCPKTCQTCSPSFPVQPPPCVDNISNCTSYDVGVCTGSSKSWAMNNCRKFCGYCSAGSKTSGFFNKCFYKGSEYKQGERWQDGCSYDCECTDASKGDYVCYNKCPCYYNLPSQCSLARQQGECCLKPVCNFDGSYNSTSNSTGDLGFCEYNGQNYTQGQIWSDGCQKQCLCDNANTGSYICQSLCATYDWLPSNCKLVKRPGECCAKPRCEFDSQVGVISGGGSTSGPGGANGTNSGSGNKPGKCVHKGKEYGQGDSWYDGCDKFCYCDNARFGFWRCQSRCPDFHNLPTNCSMVTVLGQCCKAVHCNSPGNFTSSQTTPNTIGSAPQHRSPPTSGTYPNLPPNKPYADGQDPNPDTPTLPPSTGPQVSPPQLTCPAVEEGGVATLTCTADISSCKNTFLLGWSFDSRDFAFCTSSTCGGPYIFRDGVDISIGAMSSTVTVQNVTRDSPYVKTRWGCGFCGGSPVSINKIDVYVLPENPSCTVSEEFEPRTGDIVAVRVNCSTTRVYPEAKCKFVRMVDGGKPIPITTDRMYMHIPDNQTDVSYFRSWCSVRVPVVKLGEGTHKFKVDIYPDVFNGAKVAKTVVPIKTVKLDLPRATHECPENLLGDYLCGKPNVCNCSLVHKGYPKGTPLWYKRGVFQKQAVGGAMVISYNGKDPEIDFTCEAVSVLGRKFGSSLKFAVEPGCS